jgi:hypothetical protein
MPSAGYVYVRAENYDVPLSESESFAITLTAL